MVHSEQGPWNGSMTLRTTKDLLAEGRTDRDLRRAVGNGHLVRIRRGVYSDEEPDTPVERHRLLIEATAPCLGDVVLSHESAAVLHGLHLPHGPGELVQVTRTRRTPGGGQRNQVVHTHGGWLAADDIVTAEGFRVTARARTLVDVARGMSFDDAVVLLDAALRSPDHPGEESAMFRAELEGEIARSRRVPGVKMARDALAFADGRSGSPLESRSRIIMWRHGLPRPVLQHVVVDDHGHVIARLDFAWLEEKVYGECDGAVKYDELLAPGQTARQVLMAEKHRDNALADRGWRQVRWMGPDLARPKVLCGRIQQALAGSRRPAA